MTERGLRVVTLCGSIKPLFSGTDDYNQLLTEALQRRDAEVYPVDPGGWGLAYAARLLRAVSAVSPDVILMQYPTDAFGRGLAPHVFSTLQTAAPLVLTLHEFTAAHLLRRLSIGPLLARAAAVVTTADREASTLSRWYPWLRNRVSITPIGANVPTRRWSPVERPRIMYFGQVRPRKGIEEFFVCRDRLAAIRPDVEYTIIGSPVPQFADYFRQVAAAARARNIDLITGLNRDGVSDLLATATLALLPFPDGASLRRGSLLAAAACGVPIVTRLGQDTPASLAALLPPATTIDEMEAAVRRFLADASALEAGHKRSLQIGKSVDWAAIANSYIDIFCSLTGMQCAGMTLQAGVEAEP